jgi:rhodanese-related sulfurtransferase
MENLQEGIQEIKDAMPKTNLADRILDAKEALPNITPTPPSHVKQQASVHELKSRLEWGEPGLTILDVRDRESFHRSHITGSMNMPLEELVDRAKSSLEPVRDIYVYSDSDDLTAQAANHLRRSGFVNVVELKGGLEAWKAIAGPAEGPEEMQSPGPEAYNIVARLAHHMATQKTNFLGVNERK